MPSELKKKKATEKKVVNIVVEKNKNKTKKTVKKNSNFLVNKKASKKVFVTPKVKSKKISKSEISIVDNIKKNEIEDIFDFERKIDNIEEKNEHYIDFLHVNNSINELDELLDEALMNQDKEFVFDKKDGGIEIEERRENKLERMIKDDVAMGEYQRMNNNFNMKLDCEDNVDINSKKDYFKKSKNIIDLKRSWKENEVKKVEEEFFLKRPEKVNLKTVSSLYFREVIHLASKSKSFNIVYSFGKGASGFFSILFNIIFSVFKFTIKILYGFFVFVNSFGKRVSNVGTIRETKIKDKKIKIERVKTNFFDKKVVFETSNIFKVFGFVFSCVLIIVVIHTLVFANGFGSTKGKILGISEQAYMDLGNGFGSLINSDFNSAQNSFGSANDKFEQAQEEIEKYNSFLIEILKLIPDNGKKLDSGTKLLEVGHAFSVAANSISIAFSVNKDMPLTQKIRFVSNKLKETKEEIKLAGNTISDIDEDLIPENYRDKFSKMKKDLPELSENIDELINLLDSSLTILGDESMKRYLFLFQNSNELRPTGGFMGSLAIIDVSRGKISNVKVPGGGPYDYQSQMFEKIAPPKPLCLANPNFNFWDANWWPNFPSSASMVLKYFYKSGGPTVDGVVAINSSIMKDLLKITGPIRLDEYNMTISSDNFIKDVEHYVEFGYDKAQNRPKEIIGDLMQKILDKIFEQKDIDYLETLSLFEKSIVTKDIQFYFKDPSIQEKILKLNWGGKVSNTEKDYLAVINSNIGGGKTDEFISQEISHNVNVLSNGVIIDTVKIKRKFVPQLDNIFASSSNKNYMRIYVPEGSKLLEATGFSDLAENICTTTANLEEDPEINELSSRYFVDELSGVKVNTEFNKTVYGGWQEIKPGEEKEIYLKYQLPFTLSFNKNNSFWSSFLFKNNNSLNFDSYSIYYQKQSGINSKLYTNYSWGSGLDLVWSSMDKFSSNVLFDRDLMRAFIIKK